MFKHLNLPNTLTLIRLILSPLILPLILVYLLPLNYFWLNTVLACVFILLSLTDFFDGYLARKYNQETVLGKLLDPLADKFLTYSALIALLAAGKIYFYWVIILVGRELFILGLRHVALEYDLEIPVSALGKIKTFLLMTCITFIIFNPYQQLGLTAMRWNGIEFALLASTILLSLLSAKQYYDEFIHQFMQQLKNQEEEATCFTERSDD